jgi:hypothetical protein
MATWTAILWLAPIALDPASRWRPSVEIDPRIFIDWALGGREYSIHVLVKPPRSRWRFGLDNYGGDLPSQTLSGDAQAWTVRETAWGIQAQWYFLPSMPGLFAGSFLLGTHWQYRIANAQTATWRLGLMPEAGYQWIPWGDRGLYLTPWIGAVVDSRVSGSPVIASGRTYPESVFTPILALHIGYEF